MLTGGYTHNDFASDPLPGYPFGHCVSLQYGILR
jgi:hypothetical protein